MGDRLKDTGLRQSRFFVLIVLLLPVLSACSAKWQVKSEAAQTPYVLASSQTETRIVYKQSIKGFEETGGPLYSLVFGKSEAGFERPVALAVARDGRFAIADTGLKCVHLYIPSESLYVMIAGSRTDYFTSPVSVAFDSALRLYVSDSAQGKVFVFDRNGAYLSTTGSGPFIRPTGLAWDPGKKFLFVLDTLENRVYILNEAGERVASFGERGDGKGQFNFPSHIAVSSRGDLYVVDTMNFRLQMLTDSGVLLSSFGRHGNGSGDFAMPKGVAVDSTGIIYVVDMLFDTVQLFNRQGDFLFSIGRRGTGDGEFWMPSGIFIDGRDRLYVCDTFNRRIQVFQIIKN